jgi:hypothetical protein
MNKSSARVVATLIALAVGTVSLSSCQSNGFASSLTLTGAETQRDLAVDVRRTLEAQEACHAEFSDAFEVLDRLQSADESQVGQLYDGLQGQVDKCADRVRKSSAHIGQLRDSGTALIADWTAELEQFVSPRMRSRSEGRMHEAQVRLDDLLARLEHAQVQMEEILMLQRDYVLFFNHNLSANSIASLEDENEHFEYRMQDLAEEFAEVRRVADAFVVEMQGAPSSAPASGDDS